MKVQIVRAPTITYLRQYRVKTAMLYIQHGLCIHVIHQHKWNDDGNRKTCVVGILCFNEIAQLGLLEILCGFLQPFQYDVLLCTYFFLPCFQVPSFNVRPKWPYVVYGMATCNTLRFNQVRYQGLNLHWGPNGESSISKSPVKRVPLHRGYFIKK